MAGWLQFKLYVGTSHSSYFVAQSGTSRRQSCLLCVLHVRVFLYRKIQEQWLALAVAWRPRSLACPLSQINPSASIQQQRTATPRLSTAWPLWSSRATFDGLRRLARTHYSGFNHHLLHVLRGLCILLDAPLLALARNLSLHPQDAPHAFDHSWDRSRVCPPSRVPARQYASNIYRTSHSWTKRTPIDNLRVVHNSLRWDARRTLWVWVLLVTFQTHSVFRLCWISWLPSLGQYWQLRQLLLDLGLGMGNE